jgi:hypothetical protein
MVVICIAAPLAFFEFALTNSFLTRACEVYSNIDAGVIASEFAAILAASYRSHSLRW